MKPVGELWRRASCCLSERTGSYPRPDSVRLVKRKIGLGAADSRAQPAAAVGGGESVEGGGEDGEARRRGGSGAGQRGRGEERRWRRTSAGL